jgi:hypothetical protein
VARAGDDAEPKRCGGTPSRAAARERGAARMNPAGDDAEQRDKEERRA